MQVSPSTARIRFGPFELDRSSGELRKFGHKVRLQEQPFQILGLLLDQPGELITREQLQQKLWPADTYVDFEHGLNNAIKRLREALSDSAERPRYVETLPRRGYRFIAELQPMEKPPAAAPEPVFLDLAVPAPVRTLRGSAAALTTIAIISALFMGGFYVLRSNVPARPTIRSIAVLPLENLSGDPGQRYFADGLTDALTTELAQISSLRVVSRTSAGRYREAGRSIPQIAKELGVDAVVEGSVARDNDHVRVTAQLIHGATDRHLWANSYDRKVGDVVTLESEVANEIAHQVAATLTPDEKARLLRARSVDPAAYDLYLQAKYYAQTLNRKDNDTAIDLLEKALDRDPQFAMAYSAIAFEYRTRGVELNRNAEPWTRKAFVAAEKCVALDPELADCYVARATVLWTAAHHYPHESAVADLKHALALNPNSDEAHHQLAYIFNHIGLLNKAEQHIATAQALNPANPGARFRVAINLIYQGRYQEALGRIRDSQDFMPSLWAYQTAFALVQLGRREEAAALLRQSESNDRTETAALLRSMEAILAAAAGNNGRAEQKMREAVAMGSGFQHFHHIEYGVASAYALMNRRTEALQWLRRAAGDGFPCYPLYARDPNLANLRTDPRFIAFMGELRQQWQHYQDTL